VAQARPKGNGDGDGRRTVIGCSEIRIPEKSHGSYRGRAVEHAGGNKRTGYLVDVTVGRRANLWGRWWSTLDLNIGHK